MRILNLYAGIGGNRKLWGNEHEITAIEYDKATAEFYKSQFPNDNVVVTDAHEYLINNYMNFDFIWASPPCPTHSKLRTMNKKVVYPDMTLWQEIIFLKHWFRGLYVVENVEPYYDYIINPSIMLERHPIWCNFKIQKIEFERLKTCKIRNEKKFLEDKFGFDLSKSLIKDKRKALRNCVQPETGLHILNCALGKFQTIKTNQTSILDYENIFS